MLEMWDPGPPEPPGLKIHLKVNDAFEKKGY